MIMHTSALTTRLWERITSIFPIREEFLLSPIFRPAYCRKKLTWAGSVFCLRVRRKILRLPELRLWLSARTWLRIRLAQGLRRWWLTRRTRMKAVCITRRRAIRFTCSAKCLNGLKRKAEFLRFTSWMLKRRICSTIILIQATYIMRRRKKAAVRWWTFRFWQKKRMRTRRSS